MYLKAIYPIDHFLRHNWIHCKKEKYSTQFLSNIPPPIYLGQQHIDIRSEGGERVSAATTTRMRAAEALGNNTGGCHPSPPSCLFVPMLIHEPSLRVQCCLHAMSPPERYSLPPRGSARLSVEPHVIVTWHAVLDWPNRPPLPDIGRRVAICAHPGAVLRWRKRRPYWPPPSAWARWCVSSSSKFQVRVEAEQRMHVGIGIKHRK